jgi:hypothetical protein
VAQSRQRSGHHRQARQRPLGQIDVKWIVGQRFERLDRFEPGGQNRALMKVELAYRLGAPFFRHALGREPQGGAGIWHRHHRRSLRLVGSAVGGGKHYRTISLWSQSLFRPIQDRRPDPVRLLEPRHTVDPVRRD